VKRVFHLAASVRVRLPGGMVFEHGIEDGEQLAQAGHDSLFLRFSCRQETLVEGPEGRVAARGVQRAHGERRADGASPTPDCAMAAERAAVATRVGRP
jgi:hypothetical protein